MISHVAGTVAGQEVDLRQAERYRECVSFHCRNIVFSDCSVVVE